MTAPESVTQADREAGQRLTRLIMGLPISMELVLVNTTHELSRHRQSTPAFASATCWRLTATTSAMPSRSPWGRCFGFMP